MAYSNEVYTAAMTTLLARREQAETAARRLRDTVCARYPKMVEIEQTLATTGTQISRAILSGGDIAAAINKIQTENMALQQEMADILTAAGYTVKNFEPQYTCPICDDSGYIGGKMCCCLERLLKEGAIKQVSKNFLSDPAQFDTLELQYYEDVAPEGRGMSPRQRMERIFAYCKDYAENFDASAPSLLLRGPTGTGKTHVSLAIATTVAGNGFSVLYQPAGKLFRTLEREHFGKDNGDTESIVMTCDLLILDDLGTEFETNFTTTMLYNIINTRMLDGLATVISTNLTQEGLQARYGDQIVSRITGAFEPLLFAGKDIRQQKRAAAMMQ